MTVALAARLPTIGQDLDTMIGWTTDWPVSPKDRRGRTRTRALAMAG
jgi:hypothetical protein